MESTHSSDRVPAAGQSFRDRYCERHGIAPTDFVPHLLTRNLYPTARALRWFLTPDFFGPDREFIHALGFAKTRKAFSDAQEEFHRFYTHGFWRRVLKMRVSSNRVREVFYEEVQN